MTALDHLRSADDFGEVVFEGLDLEGFDFAHKEFYRCTFRNAKLRGSRWREARLEACVFEDCDLRYTSFADMHLRSTSFVRCRLVEASFLDVDLTEADFTGSDLTDTRFEGATLSRADLTTARGVYLDPAKNRVKDVRIGMEAAALLAASFGMKVVG